MWCQVGSCQTRVRRVLLMDLAIAVPHPVNACCFKFRTILSCLTLPEMLCHVLLVLDLSSYVRFWPLMFHPCHIRPILHEMVFSCPALSCPTLSCAILSSLLYPACPVLTYLVLCYDVLFALPCLPCPALPCPVLCCPLCSTLLFSHPLLLYPLPRPALFSSRRHRRWAKGAMDSTSVFFWPLLLPITLWENKLG